MKQTSWGWPRGRVAKFTHSALATHGFTGSDPGRRRSTTHQDHAGAASHIAQPEALTTRIYNYVLRGFGEKKKKKRKDWQQMLAQVPILKKKVIPFTIAKTKQNKSPTKLKIQ